MFFVLQKFKYSRIIFSYFSLALLYIMYKMHNWWWFVECISIKKILSENKE